LIDFTPKKTFFLEVNIDYNRYYIIVLEARGRSGLTNRRPVLEKYFSRKGARAKLLLVSSKTSIETVEKKRKKWLQL